MKNEYALLQFEVIMGENLRMKIFNFSVKKMMFFITFQHLGHLNRNIFLHKMARTMLNDNLTPRTYGLK